MNRLVTFNQVVDKYYFIKEMNKENNTITFSEYEVLKDNEIYKLNVFQKTINYNFKIGCDIEVLEYNYNNSVTTANHISSYMFDNLQMLKNKISELEHVADISENKTLISLFNKDNKIVKHLQNIFNNIKNQNVLSFYEIINDINILDNITNKLMQKYPAIKIEIEHNKDNSVLYYYF